MNPASTRLNQNSVTTPVLMQKGRYVLTALKAINTTGAVAFTQIFDAASAATVTLGTTIPDWVVESDAGSTSLGDGLPTDGIVFLNGIVVASTTTPLGSVTASQHIRTGII